MLSKALAAAHEVVRRVRRDELLFAQSLLGELRSSMIRLEEPNVISVDASEHRAHSAIAQPSSPLRNAKASARRHYGAIESRMLATSRDLASSSIST